MGMEFHKEGCLSFYHFGQFTSQPEGSNGGGGDMCLNLKTGLLAVQIRPVV